MASLQIFLFGRLRILYNNDPIIAKMTHNVQSLLAYILLRPNKIESRDILAEVFWSEYGQARARSCLNTALWRLRRIIEPPDILPGTYVITSDTGDIGLNNCPEKLWLDTETFDAQLTRFVTSPVSLITADDVRKTEEVLNLYSGELLNGFYEDWVVQERERFQALYLDGLTRLMHYYGCLREFDKTIAYGQRIIRLDPFREEVHRALMKFYFDSGQRPLALQQYEACCQVLQQEFNIAPMPETVDLYQQITTNTISTITYDHAHLPASNVQFQQVMTQFQTAMRLFESASEQLRQIMQILNETVVRDA